MRKSIRILLIIISLLLAVAIAFVAWGETPARPMPEALSALQSDSQVTVTIGDWLVFEPTSAEPDTGLVFYPGGRVDYRAYAPAARKIAEQGYLVVIVKMPLNLAVLDAGAAAEVLATYPAITHWAVGGHSLGGAMAANFANKNSASVEGLVLWAAYPAGSDDLSMSDLQVVSIYANRDGLASGEEIDASRALLPAHTQWVRIEGGNHAQFGWYGEQAGDNPAGISRQAQQEQVITATVALLENLK
jgi:hypothetical protein